VLFSGNEHEMKRGSHAHITTATVAARTGKKKKKKTLGSFAAYPDRDLAILLQSSAQVHVLYGLWKKNETEITKQMVCA
jgi:hypothetical protein